MSNIVSTASPSIYKIQKWLGLNETPDGDTAIEMGEAAAMRNFRITREAHLQIRPGYGAIATLSAGKPVRGMWEGYIAGTHHVVAACDGHLYDVSVDGGTTKDLGSIGATEEAVSFFGFAKQLYILTGADYYVWDGGAESAPKQVEGYIPIVVTAVPPAGGGTLLEGVNQLTGKKRAQYSPDGTATAFQLPEKNVDEVLEVKGTDKTWTLDKANGKVNFASAPAKGTNTVTITWRKGDGDRETVTKMRFAELYNGTSDNRVFLYGDGTNRAIYSGLDELGQPSAEYFPSLNQVGVDSANTPITAMIRHYDRMLIFKTDSAYSMSYSTIDANGLTQAAFYVSSLNRAIGNAAPGQARLVENAARTVYERSVYDWALASNSTRDERNAVRVGDKVATTLGSFDLSKCICCDDEWNQEYYIFCDGQAVVQSYANKVKPWWYYTDLPVTAVVALDGALYFGTPDGRVMEFSRKYRSDDKQPIDAYWESGSMAFDMDWKRKYSSMIWVAIKPENQALIYATASSNLKSGYPEKLIACGLSNFLNVDFKHWSFGVNRKPQNIRAKLKVKKATYYKLILHNKSASATATVLSVDFQVRYTGNVK